MAAAPRRRRAMHPTLAGGRRRRCRTGTGQSSSRNGPNGARVERKKETAAMAIEGIEITHQGSDARGEYRAAVPGSDAIGRLTWFARGDTRIADHTLVPPEIGGKGVAAALV